jgi:hypothetical protein
MAQDPHINPASGVWDDNYYAQNHQSSGGGNTSSGGNLDIVGQAQKLLDFQKSANAPVISQLQTQQPGLQDKYKQLVDSIKGNQQLDTNRQTLTTNNQLGARGILPSSGVYQQEMTNALTPIDTQYAGLTANANAGSIADTQGLALQIAQLQAGNPESALSGAFQYGGLQNQANSIAAQNALAAAQGQLAQSQAQNIPIQGIGLYNTASKQLINQFNGGGGNQNGITWVNGQPYINQ